MFSEKDSLLSRKEAAEFLGLKASTLAIWLCKKSMPLKVVKVGRLAKYKMSDLIEFVESRTQEGCSSDFMSKI